MQGLVRTPAVESFATVHDARDGRARFAGVILDDDAVAIGSVCTCGRSACEHAAAVAVALRAALHAGQPPPFAERGDLRFSELR